MVEAVSVLGPEVIPVLKARGQILDENVEADSDLPPFDNSAVDGYAIRASDVGQAAANDPQVLRVVEHLPAGVVPTRPVRLGEATRIMTGAPLPETLKKLDLSELISAV